MSSIIFNWINPQGSATGGGATSTTTSKGANAIVAGDLLVAVISILVGANSDPGAITPPAGWTQATQCAQGSGIPEFSRQGVFYKIAGSSETGSYTFSWTTGADCNWTLLDYTVVGTAAFDVAANTPATNTTTAVAPSVSPIGSTDLLICTGFTDGRTWSGNFAGMTSRQLDSNISGFGDISVAIADLILSSSGSTGTKTASTGFGSTVLATASTFSVSGGGAAARTPTLTLMGVG